MNSLRAQIRSFKRLPTSSRLFLLAREAARAACAIDRSKQRLRLVIVVRTLELALSIVCASCSLCVFILHSCVLHYYSFSLSLSPLALPPQSGFPHSLGRLYGRIWPYTVHGARACRGNANGALQPVRIPLADRFACALAHTPDQRWNACHDTRTALCTVAHRARSRERYIEHTCETRSVHNGHTLDSHHSPRTLRNT